jgi:hypothetical protein
MFRIHKNLRGLHETILAVALVGTMTLAGCGTDVSTAPETLNIAEEPTGEVPLPIKRPRIPAPIGFEVQSITAEGADLRWVSPGSGYVAQVRLDGTVIGHVDAATGQFNDALNKVPGLYNYGLCFMKGDRAGREVVAEAKLNDVPDDTGRTDDRIDDGSN